MKAVSFFLLALPLVAAQKKNPVPAEKPPLYFSKIATGRLEAKEFSCKEDSVYAFLRLPKKIYGEHNFWFYWRRPDGKIQDSAKLFVPPRPPGQRHFPAYLEFHVPEPDITDVFFASGEDPGEEFSGLWHAQAVLDGKIVLKGTFKVVCP